MIIGSFQVEDKLEKAYFFQKTFLVANISIKVLVEMLIFTFSNTNKIFVDKKKTYLKNLYSL